MKRYAIPDRPIFPQYFQPAPQESLQRSLQQGVTLVELVISIVILSIALVALITTMSSSASRSSDILLEDRTIQLAQAYFDEILNKRFAEETGLGGYPPATGCSISREESSRANYDDVDDYHGLDEDPASQTANGFFSGASVGYNVQVDVSCSDAATELGVTSNKAKRITLTITDAIGRQRTFAAYKGNY